VKLVVSEQETDALVGYLGDAALAVSEVALVEVPRAAHLKTRAAETIPHAEALLRRFFLIALDDELYEEAARARPAELRSLDAVHLASALRVQDRIEAAVVYDRRLGSAAWEAGIRVEAPGSTVHG
jgi:predicted nucleic acid-binding protein